jgi:hypothetical protein
MLAGDAISSLPGEHHLGESPVLANGLQEQPTGVEIQDLPEFWTHNVL